MKKLLVFAVAVAALIGAHRKGVVIKVPEESGLIVMIDNDFRDDYVRQRKENWCWAACVQMVMYYYGIYVSQGDIAERVYGYEADRMTSGKRMAEDLDGWRINGERIRAKLEMDQKKIPAYLIKGIPVIAGLKNPYGGASHAYVLNALVSEDGGEGYVPLSVRLVDPAIKGEPEDMEVRLEYDDFIERLQSLIIITKE